MNREMVLGSYSLSPTSPHVRAQELHEQGNGPGLLFPIPHVRAQELHEQGSGPGLSFPIPHFPSPIISHTVSVDVKRHKRKTERKKTRNVDS